MIDVLSSNPVGRDENPWAYEGRCPLKVDNTYDHGLCTEDRVVTKWCRSFTRINLVNVKY